MMKKILRASWLALVLLFMYLPVLMLMVYSFTDTATIGTAGHFSLQNYRTLLEKEELRSMIAATFMLAFGSALLATILGTMGAVGAFYCSRGPKKAIHYLNQIPVVNADVVTGFSLCVLLIVVCGLDKETLVPLVVGHVVLEAPFVYLSVRPKIAQMDNSIYEAALDLGASARQALFRVMLPQLVPGIVSGFMLAVTLSLDDYFVTTYTKPATFDTISTYVVNATKGSHTEIKTALWALSTVIFVLILTVVLAGNFLMSRRKKATAALGLGLALAAFGVPMTAQAEESVVLRVCNWEEYIDEGDWAEDELIDLDSCDIFGDNSLVDDFEAWYYENYGVRVEVEYSTFGTNEDLYSQLNLGNVYDLVCPSDYMIMKLMAEGRLEPLSDDFFDTTKEENYYINGVSPYIKSVFEENEIGGEPWSDYAAGYMWGVTGMIYNPDEVTAEEASTWSILTNDKFYRQITVKDNVRDAYFPTLAILNGELLTSGEFTGSSDYHARLADVMNDTDQETIARAEAKLKEIRRNVYSFETDSGKADMISGKVLASLQWSGDAVYAMDQAEEDDFYLNWAVPKECTNLWFDGWVMLSDGIDGDEAKKQAAQAFINYLSKPESVIRNMYYIGYTSAIAGGESDLIYEYLNWNYGADEEETDTIEYPLGYFFSGEAEDENYVITAPAEQANRQLSAQYPTQDVIARSAVMMYFDEEGTANINSMWINIRCFNLSMLTAGQWGLLAIAVLLAVIAVAAFASRDDWFRPRQPRGYRRIG